MVTQAQEIRSNPWEDEGIDIRGVPIEVGCRVAYAVRNSCTAELRIGIVRHVVDYAEQRWNYKEKKSYDVWHKRFYIEYEVGPRGYPGHPLSISAKKGVWVQYNTRMVVLNPA